MHRGMSVTWGALRVFITAIVIAVIAIMLTACGAPEDLPAPGADGLVVLHWWDEKKAGPPAYLQAESVQQNDAEFGKLDFSRVMMRLPNDSGVVYVIAPWASYNRGNADAIVMGAEKDRPLDGPVRFIGTWNNELFMGRAQGAVFEEAKRRMRLDHVEIIVSGSRQRTDWAALSQDQSPSFGPTEPLPMSPALTAALAALPAPLVFPPMRQ